MQRRKFLTRTAIMAGGIAATGSLHWPTHPTESRSLGPVWGFEPVIGDGRWVWREPPKEERGYLEGRPYELRIGIEMQSMDSPCQAMASTPVPMNYPEQSIDEVTIENFGCEAQIRELGPGASQLLLHASEIAPGQSVKAIAHYKMTLYKQYHGFEQDLFPAKQSVSPEIRTLGLGESPGIQVNASATRRLAAELSKGLSHPWAKAQSFSNWIRANIRGQIGVYTSVLTAIQKKVGDCEEMSALFVALCRASGIPARLVWVPNHNWAEFYLTDNEDNGHWIPAHPACYHWFGWTGAHELVIQKGDRVQVPELSSPSRLLMDWSRSTGRTKTNYLAELVPLPPTTNADPGPGSRTKDSRTGEWKLTGKHELDRYTRR